jgi:hypothetical protein
MNESYLILIGNGFDLAHGMKTSYSDFIRYVIDLHLSNRKVSPILFRKSSSHPTYEDVIKSFKGQRSKLDASFNNKLFMNLLRDFALKNWCDLEEKYFEELYKIAESKVKKLNEEFEEIKIHLVNYLVEQQKLDKGKKSESYSAFFKHFKGKHYKVLNFNYTNTLEKYSSEIEEEAIIHLHGELGIELNPMIFGYAASDSEARELSGRKEKEYLRNVKKICYKRSNETAKFKRFLKIGSGLKVFIFGHSCGESDKLILNQILNNERVNEIRLFFYEDYEHYFEQAVSIDRIMKDDENFNNKVINQRDSHRMPQINDDNEKISAFKSYVLKNIEFRTDLLTL